MTPPRRVAVFTSSRADLGPLGPVIEALRDDPGIELAVIVSGTHVVPEYGRAEGGLDALGVELLTVDSGLRGTDPAALGDAFGLIAAGVTKCLAERPFDLVLVLGDRWELLAVAGAALLNGVALAHLHGGETTEGAIDERIRHGITKLADLHLCASPDSAARIRRLGEEPWRIVVTGAPGLDRTARTRPMSEDRLAELSPSTARPLAVVVYHPETVDRADQGARARQVFYAAARECGTVVVLHPGADPGSDEIRREIELLAALPNVVAVANLGNEYLPLLAAADVLIGNSSSGIIEAASFELPVVDVGDRQRGRLRSRNVVHVQDVDDVAAAVRTVLDPGFRRSLSGLSNPYGDGRAAPRIAQALREVPLARLPRKPLMEAEEGTDRVARTSVSVRASLGEALATIDRGGQQIALLVEDDGVLVGTLTDGDVRRALIAGASLDESALGSATTLPVTVGESTSLPEVWGVMRRTGVFQVPVLDATGRLIGLRVMREVIPVDPADRS